MEPNSTNAARPVANRANRFIVFAEFHFPRSQVPSIRDRSAHLAGVRRFSEFQKNIGLAKNILTVRLRARVDDGILKTAPASDGSADQEYVLTPKGRGVFPVLVALRQWNEEFCCERGAFPTLLVDRSKGRPVRKLELRAIDGRLPGDGETEVRPNPIAKRRRSVLGA